MAFPWTALENETLKSLAGRQPIADIAKRLNRSISATYVQASKLDISFRRAAAKQLRAVSDGESHHHQ
jgi:hypothetical protein